MMNTSRLTGTQSQNLSKTLYVELILDGYRSETFEGVLNLLKVFEWTIDGTMDEIEFSRLFRSWLQKQRTVRDESIILSEIQFRRATENYPEKSLDMMIGLLINEHNATFRDNGCQVEWINAVEHLFFLLDVFGNSYLTIDELHFLISALLGDDALRLTPEQFVNKTGDFMRDVDPYDGVITLRRFKSFFCRNNLDTKIILNTIQCLEKDMSQWQTLMITGARDGIPKLWFHSVVATKRELVLEETDSRKALRYPALEKYLLHESHGVKYKNYKHMFTAQSAIALFEDFALRYKLKNVDVHSYHENNLPRHPYFTFVAKALSWYRQLIKDVLSHYTPSINNLDFSKNLSPLSNISRNSSNRNLNSSLDYEQKMFDTLEQHAYYNNYYQEESDEERPTKLPKTKQTELLLSPVEISPSPVKKTTRKAQPAVSSSDSQNTPLTNATPLEERVVNQYMYSYEQSPVSPAAATKQAKPLPKSILKRDPVELSDDEIQVVEEIHERVEAPKRAKLAPQQVPVKQEKPKTSVQTETVTKTKKVTETLVKRQQPSKSESPNAVPPKPIKKQKIVVEEVEDEENNDEEEEKPITKPSPKDLRSKENPLHLDKSDKLEEKPISKLQKERTDGPSPTSKKQEDKSSGPSTASPREPVTPTREVHSPRNPNSDVYRKTVLPFDIDMMIRNAEWNDVKAENFEDFQYLPIRCTYMPYQQLQDQQMRDVQSSNGPNRPAPTVDRDPDTEPTGVTVVNNLDSQIDELSISAEVPRKQPEVTTTVVESVITYIPGTDQVQIQQIKAVDQDTGKVIEVVNAGTESKENLHKVISQLHNKVVSQKLEDRKEDGVEMKVQEEKIEDMEIKTLNKRETAQLEKKNSKSPLSSSSNNLKDRMYSPPANKVDDITPKSLKNILQTMRANKLAENDFRNRVLKEKADVSFASTSSAPSVSRIQSMNLDDLGQKKPQKKTSLRHSYDGRPVESSNLLPDFIKSGVKKANAARDIVQREKGWRI